MSNRSAQVLALLIAIVAASLFVLVALCLAVRGAVPLPTPERATSAASGQAAATTSPALGSPTPAVVWTDSPSAAPATVALPPPSPTPQPTLAPTPAVVLPSPVPTRPVYRAPAGQKYGIHLLLDDGRGRWPPEVWPEHLRAAREIVGEGGYVIQLVRLDDLDVARWQYFLDLCAEQRLVPILRLAGEYDHDKKWWIAPPKDAGGEGYADVARRYRDFVAALRWPAEPRYVIVYNEPNRGDEWSNRPDAAEYARLLWDVGRALHEVGITVLGPALDLYCPHSNGKLIFGGRFIDAETFLDEMAAAYPQAFDVIDVWAAHAYPLDPFRLDPSRHAFQIDYANGASNPRHVDPPAGLTNRGINSYRWELWKAEPYLGPRARTMPVMITESGWRHAPSQEPASSDAAHAEISFDTLSAYLDLAFHGNGGRYPDLPEAGWTPWSDDPRVAGVVLFALGGNPRVWGHTNWVTVDRRGRVTGRYPIGLSR